MKAFLISVVLALFTFSLSVVAADEPGGVQMCPDGQQYMDYGTYQGQMTWRCSIPGELAVNKIHDGEYEDTLQLFTNITFWTLSEGTSGTFIPDKNKDGYATWGLVVTRGATGNSANILWSWDAPGYGEPISVEWADYMMNETTGSRQTFMLTFESGMTLCGSFFLDNHVPQLQSCDNADIQIGMPAALSNCFIEGLFVEENSLFARFFSNGQAHIVRWDILNDTVLPGEAVDMLYAPAEYQVEVAGMKAMTWGSWVIIWQPYGPVIATVYPCEIQ